MSWITILWSMTASASLTFALIHLFIWGKGIQPWANLSFSIAATCVAIITGMELMSMRTESIEHMAAILRWAHLPILVLWAAIVCFVRFYFDAGRSWLIWTGLGLRLLALILSFSTGQNLFFKEITRLKRIEILGGETIHIPEGSLNSWYIVGPLSTLVLAVYVMEATLTMWRRNTPTDRRRAIILSGSILFFLLGSVVHSILVNMGAVNSPYIVGLSFMPVLLAMAYELSCDMLHSVQITQKWQASKAELRINKQRMKLAASAADLRMWEWDIIRDEVLSTGTPHALYGLSASEKLGFDRFMNLVYDEDRRGVRLAVEKAMTGNGHYESEYRITMPDGQLRWFNSRGRIEFGDRNQPLRMLGVTIDITRRKQAELEVQQQRNELAHLSRVNLLGELSGSLAHELNQPLSAILCNAQAAERFLARETFDLTEVREILAEIVAEDKRASDIIQRLRLLLRKGEVQRLPVDLNKVVQDVLMLMKSDLVNHNFTVNADLDPNLTPVTGDRVQLQQVLLNLILNACEAVNGGKEKKCRLHIRTGPDGEGKARVSVIDEGPGIPFEHMPKIFEPFFTTKSQGMGLGLPICRTIITAHGGRLWAGNNDHGGTAFHFTVPIFQGENA